MPRRVDQIDPTHDSSEMAAFIACEATGLLVKDGMSHSERTSRIGKFVGAFIKARQKLSCTNIVDMQRGRLANKFYYYGMARTVQKKHVSQSK